MKKLIVILSVIAIVVMMSTPALAFDVGEVSGIVSAAKGAEGFYEASVIMRMLGRAGASTIDGAKGIAFEILYCDKTNVANGFWNGIHAKLSESSIDPLADIIITNSDGSIAILGQCKDGISDSYINKVLRDVISGKYDGVELIGTTEFAERFNVKAEAQGLAARVKDSGITTKITSKIGSEALNIVPTGSQIISDAIKASGIAMIITIPFSAVESILRGDDYYEAAGNMITDLGINGVAAPLGSVASAGATALLVALEVSPAGVVVGSTIVGILVPVSAGYALYRLSEEYELEETVTEAVRLVCDDIQIIIIDVASDFAELDLQGKTFKFYESAKEIATDVGAKISDGYNAATDWVKGSANKAGDYFSRLFS